MTNPTIIDISRSIDSESLVYPGDDHLDVSPICSIGPECPCNITKLGWSTHFLTHVDPPLHFVKDGKSLDEIPLERFMGKARVIEVLGDCVKASDIPDESLQGVTVLFRTRNSAEFSNNHFNENHVYVSKEAAQKAVAVGINMVGIDYISVDKYGDADYPAHNTLLGNNVLIIEGLDLSAVSPGEYTFSALPLKISKGDGSPVRAILQK